MSICVKTIDKTLVVSEAVPCDGVLLVEQADVKSGFGFADYSLLAGAIIACYCLAFIFRQSRKQMGIY
ncbi:hypothetical protein [Shewanella algae]|uniref:hypothetical protein n=1 Tax=Shewanella algae TaxID=38313 RepID=UPI000B8A8C00|nr:hypothetical protein [Shewanella algae]MBO2556777.1 hypothetical protein [Shewanella algae]MBO2556788.1 hypothetical protein [Shewanella algae]MBO2573711.1 hypothetical protein [Shewanella algae]MBO2573722.1 hypothetical protein [Shewanella algae]MBO2683542.1 hypothetical protein [Shewanella algae]